MPSRRVSEEGFAISSGYNVWARDFLPWVVRYHRMQIMKRFKTWVLTAARPVLRGVVFATGLGMVVPVAAQLAVPVPQPSSALQPPLAPGLLPVPAQVPRSPPLTALPSVQRPALQTPAVIPGIPGPVPVLPQTAPIVRTDPAPSVAPTVAQRLQALVPLDQLRGTTVRELLQRHADVLEADPRGEPVRRQELLWVSPKAPSLKSALALGFSVLREQRLPELDLHKVVLRPPTGVATARALEQLRALAPDVEADFNHVYTRSAEVFGAPSAARPMAAAPLRVGLIDGGVDRQHAALRGARLHPWGCGGVEHPSAHGTAVASLLAGRETVFAGSVNGTTLYTADIYCGQPADGAAETIALALAWMVRENVAVVNISLVGSANVLLERAVQALVRKGFLLVAAVGNDGPAAPPLYPAAYDGVVGVTAVSPLRKPLPEAAQGPQVMFAALGSGVAVAEPGGGYTQARGTSFAAPRVAGLLAQHLVVPDRQRAAAALAGLIAGALDLGAAGRDPVFGHGLVGAQP